MKLTHLIIDLYKRTESTLFIWKNTSLSCLSLWSCFETIIYCI